MSEPVFLAKDTFYKKTKSTIILYNVYQYKARLKMHIAMDRILGAIDGVKTISDIAREYIKKNKTENDGVNIDVVKTLKHLLGNGFLTLDKSSGKLPESEQKIPPIDVVNLRITNSCNFNCIHCFPDSSLNKSDEFSYDELIGIINELAKYKVLHITFTGGEPFLNKNLIELVELANSKGMVVSICSNASLINDKHIERLSKCAIGALKISLDGASAEAHDAYRGKGRFNKLIPKIRRIVDAGIPVCINSVVSKLNFHEYKKLINIVQDLKATEFAYDIVRKTGRAIENWNDLGLSYEERLECMSYYYSLHPKVGDVIMGSAIFPLLLSDVLEQEYYSKACGTCLSNIVILANGDVTPCWRLYDNDLIAGNLRQNNLDYIWNSSELFTKIRALEIDSLKKCNSCEHRVFCNASCRGFALQNHNDWYGEPDPERCKFHLDLQKRVTNN